MESALSMDNMFQGQVMTAQPLRGGAVFRWESSTAGILILAALGGTTPPPLGSCELLDLDQLAMLASPENLVGYRGCDAEQHYFTLPSHDAYTVPRTCWNVTAMPVTLGLCIPLCFNAGRLAIPSSHWSRQVDLNTLQWAIQ